VRDKDRGVELSGAVDFEVRFKVSGMFGDEGIRGDFKVQGGDGVDKGGRGRGREAGIRDEVKDLLEGGRLRGRGDVAKDSV
jgi:hypothetical protein